MFMIGDGRLECHRCHLCGRVVLDVAWLRGGLKAGWEIERLVVGEGRRKETKADLDNSDGQERGNGTIFERATPQF